MTQDRSRYLGLSFFIHPLPLGAVLVMILNDHFFKELFHNQVTGKLSDLMGLFFLPLFLLACLELITRFFKTSVANIRVLVFLIVISDVFFMSLNLSVSFSQYYQKVMLMIGVPTRVTVDPTDLIVLPVNFLTYLYASKVLKPK